MFEALKPLVATTTVKMEISAEGDGMMRVIVKPEAKEGVVPALKQPLLLKGTPRELDEGFLEHLSRYTRARTGLESNLDSVEKLIAAANKDANTKATKALGGEAAKSPAPEKGAEKQEAPTSSDGEVDLFAND